MQCCWSYLAGAVPRRKRGGDAWRSLAREQQAQEAGLDDLAGERPSEAQRSVRQRRNPPNHTDLASVLELIEDMDAAAHDGRWLYAHPPSFLVSGLKRIQGS